ncbi:MAG: branched-chain amino acid ABC transporter substrate-binding protein [Proteobacteria bacterium]|nr:branched-chain amino acid ABC transporter substrate-binding protein [Pseudomonadota bacterium]
MWKPIGTLSIAVLSVALWSCTGAGQKAIQQPAGNVIEIGVAGPMSGELAVFGEQLRKGVEMAVADINAAGGLNGKQLHLNIGDDQCDPAKARRVANNLSDEGVSFVVGHFCSGSSIPASEVYGPRNILQITPSSTNPALTEGAASDGITTVLRTTGRDDRQGDTILAWLKQTYSGQVVAVLDDGTAYGAQVADVVKRGMTKADFAEVVVHSFTSRQKNFDTLSKELADKGVKAVFVGGYHDEIAPFARAMRAIGSTAEIAGPDALNTSEFWTLAGKAGEGVRYTDGAPAISLASATGVVAKFRNDGYEPEGYTLSSYAAVQAFAAAAKGTGAFDGAKLAAWLKANTVPSVVGDLTWDAKGDLKDPRYAWYVYHDGAAYRE